MHIDTFLRKGSTHYICEDYIIKSKNAVVLSDGCSSTENSDVGARLLSYAANYELDKILQKDFANSVITRASIAAKTIGVDAGALFCTLGVMAKYSDAVVMQLFGDGVMFVKTKSDNKLYVYIVNYEGNAPPYLAYLEDIYSKEAYLDTTKKRTIVTAVYTYEDGKIVNEELFSKEEDFKTEIPFSKNVFLDTDEVEFCGIASDGFTTFDMKFQDIVEGVANFKTTKGEFLKRRMKKFTKENNHFDDISIGVMMFDDDLH